MEMVQSGIGHGVTITLFDNWTLLFNNYGNGRGHTRASPIEGVATRGRLRGSPEPEPDCVNSSRRSWSRQPYCATRLSVSAVMRDDGRRMAPRRYRSRHTAATTASMRTPTQAHTRTAKTTGLRRWMRGAAEDRERRGRG